MTEKHVKWARRPLESLAEGIDYGHTASASERPIGPRFLRITDIQNGSVEWGSIPFCSASQSETEKYSLRPGDVVFARTDNTTGKSYLIAGCPETTVFASDLIRVRPSKDVEPRYLGYFFNTPDYWAQIKRNARGAGQPGVNATKLKQLEVPLPPLPEQKRIADILDKADDIRRKRSHTIKRADELIPSIFCETFGDHPLGKGHPVADLGECADIVSGVTKGRRFNGQPTLMLPYLRVANVQDGRLDISEIKTIEVLASDLERLRLQPGDVLLTEGGDYDKLGRGALWEGQIDNCIHQNHIFRVRTDRTKVLPVFFANYLQTRHAKAYFLRCAKKTTNLASINMRQLRALPVPLPPITQQQKFQEEYEEIRELTKKCADATAQAGEMFASLLQRAFRGEL